MFLQIHLDDTLAIYDQVVRQVKFAVANGAVRAGEFVPSVRELARELAINPNTVSRAYRQLQDEGVLETVRGTGLAVAKGAAPICRRHRLELVGQRIRDALREGKQSQLADEELRRLVERQMADVLREES